VLKVLSNRYVRLAISLAAALVITWFSVATLTEKQPAYRHLPERRPVKDLSPVSMMEGKVCPVQNSCCDR